MQRILMLPQGGTKVMILVRNFEKAEAASTSLEHLTYETHNVPWER
jgi:hypothetical protein